MQELPDAFMTPSLYIHIPVCLKKCAYCDFFSVPVNSFPGFMGQSINLMPLVEALKAEIACRKAEFAINGWKTVYIGGGTPSLLSAGDIRELAAPLASELAMPGEFTIEANPEDLTEEWLAACRSAGINRLSLGIQSMHDESLKAVSRRGQAASNRKALELVTQKWTGRLSLDLISGLPGQTKSILARDIEELVSYGPDHISLYSLTVEEGTPLEKIFAREAYGDKHGQTGFPNIPDEDEAADLWIQGRNLLENKGYFQYEVSNFAQPGSESRHNMTYWNLETYIGAGPGATGTVNSGDTARRMTNTTDIAQWLAHPQSSFSVETISRDDCVKEVLLMGMRTLSGINRERFQERFGTDIGTMIPATIAAWQKKGMLSADRQHVALNREGLLFLNQFLSGCMDELQ